MKYIGIESLQYLVSKIKQLITQSNEINLIKAVLKSDKTTLTATEAYQVIDIPIQAELSIGSKLTMSNNQIVVGNDVQYIEISGNVVADNFSANTTFGASITKNGIEVLSN